MSAAEQLIDAGITGALLMLAVVLWTIVVIRARKGQL